MLAPEAVGIAAAVAAVGAVTGDGFVSLCAAAALVAAAYVHRLVGLARVSADQRVPPVTPGVALRSDLPRFLASVLARSAGATLLGAVAGLEIGTAALLGALVGLGIGWVQLTRQAAIVLTFRDEPDA
jgi:hypothetical protein